MFEFNATGLNYARRIHRIGVKLAFVLGVVSTLSLTFVTRADDPAPTDPGTTATAGIMIDYFAAQTIGFDRWLVEGIVAAEDLSAVSIQFGGCATGTVNPDPYGYFSLVMTAQPSDTLTADATDGTNTAHAELLLPGVFLDAI